MTSLLPGDEEDQSNVTRLKQKSQMHAVVGEMGKLPVAEGLTDESRSFLTFSRENLSMSTSELEQGFSRPCSGRGRRCRPRLLSWLALLLALGCAALELWKLRRVLGNARDIEAMRRDVEELKHRLLEKDLLDELRAFEEQLYSEGTSEDEEEEEASNNGLSGDYDSSYDDSSTGSGDYPVNGPPATPGPATSPGLGTTPCTSRQLEDVLTLLRRAEAAPGRAFEHDTMRERPSTSADPSAKSSQLVRRTRAARKFFTRLKGSMRQYKFDRRLKMKNKAMTNGFY